MVFIPEPGESRRERHQAFIGANIGQLAAVAVAGHREHGRGMVLLDDTDFMNKPRGVLTRYRIGYLAEGTAAFARIGQWPGEREAGWVAGYDPETTMLVALVRADGGLSSYRVRFA